MKQTMESIRKDFPILRRTVHGKPLVYLDNAATTLKPLCVIRAMDDYYRKITSNVHRGVHFLSEEATRRYEGTRGKVQRFLNAQHSEQIIFTRGTTDSINLVAQSFGRSSLHRGDEIIISQMEHHSNIVPWQMLCEEKGCVLKVIPINDKGELIVGEFEKLLSKKTRLVSLVYVSNSLGTINPIEKVIAAAHRQGVRVLIDAAQAVSHLKIDVQKLDCDFLAFSAHKLFGPTGTGVLYGKRELLEQMPPVQGGGDMIASVSFEKTTYAALPHKFEAGTPNISGVIGLGAAIDYLESLGFENIQTLEEELLDYGTKALNNIPDLRLIGTAKRKIALFSFSLSNIHPHDIGTLVDEQGVAIRTGHHCTMPIMRRFKVPATSRASLNFYNTKKEIECLVEALHKVLRIFS